MNAREFQAPNAEEAFVSKGKKNPPQFQESNGDLFLLQFSFSSEIVFHLALFSSLPFIKRFLNEDDLL